MDIRDPEILHRDRDHLEARLPSGGGGTNAGVSLPDAQAPGSASPVTSGSISAEIRAASRRAARRARAAGGGSLPAPLLGLQLGDPLRTEEEALPLGELALDRVLLRRTLRDDLGLVGPGLLQPHLLGADLPLEALHLRDHLRVLRADALDHVDAREQVVEALGAEHDLDDAAGAPVDVQLAEPRGDPGCAVARLRLATSRWRALRCKSASSWLSSRSRRCTPRPHGRAPCPFPAPARGSRAPVPASTQSRDQPTPTWRLRECRCGCNERRYLSHARTDRQTSLFGRDARLCAGGTRHNKSRSVAAPADGANGNRLEKSSKSAKSLICGTVPRLVNGSSRRTPSLIAAVVTGVLVTALLPGLGGADTAPSLRARATSLDRNAHGALLEFMRSRRR